MAISLKNPKLYRQAQADPALASYMHMLSMEEMARSMVQKAVKEEIATHKKEVEEESKKALQEFRKSTTKLLSQMPGMTAELKETLLSRFDTHIAAISHLQGTPGKNGYTPVKGKDYFDGMPGEPGKNGKTPTQAEITPIVELVVARFLFGKDQLTKKEMAEVAKQVQEVFDPSQNASRIARALETLIGTDRLDYKALKNRPAQQTPQFGNGMARGTATSLLTATGDVDDSNTTFTFASEPKIVVVNGASYIHGAGVTISGTSVELDNAVGTGGSIYGIR